MSARVSATHEPELHVEIDQIDGGVIERLTVRGRAWEAVTRAGEQRHGDGRREKHGSFGVLFLLDPMAVLSASSVLARRAVGAETRIDRVVPQLTRDLTDVDGVAWEFTEPTDPWPFLADGVGYRDASEFEAQINVRAGIVERWDARRADGLVLRRLELLDLDVR